MKLLGSLVASAALALSMLVAIPSAAQAAPYPGSVSTACSLAVPGAVKRNRALNVAYRARAAGNARPSGTVYFRVYKGSRLVRSFANGYTGSNIRVKSLGKFKQRGTYRVQLVFRANTNSVYRNCATGLRSFRVRR